MILKDTCELWALKELRDVKAVINNNIENNKKRKVTKRQKYELFFDNCANCNIMAAIPQAAFAVRKIRKMDENQFLQMDLNQMNSNEKGHYGGSFKKHLTEERGPTPLKYNSKLMNSIWGEYNRYSVHNFKKNTAADESGIFATAWGNIPRRSTSQAAATILADIKHHV